MIKLNLQLGLATVLTTALLAGCSGGGGSSAVSYTHLDVYKRQALPLH